MSEKDLKALDKLFDRKLKPSNEKLDSHTVSLMNLEKEIKVYMDALDVERKRINGDDKRLDVIEENLDLNL
ncbi:hypothetical protein IID22_03060 [Patescibacteria group bacterium]|nr:hypothetical protein [Patescibacteria group bacterium]